MATWLLRSRRHDAATTDFPTPKQLVVDLATAAADRGGWFHPAGAASVDAAGTG
jgi:hypothetical protein